MVENNVLKNKRIIFWNHLMEIMDKAEVKRDSTYGPFSFLWENSYVRKAVVSSQQARTDMDGLKLFLAVSVLEMHEKNNKSRITLKQLNSIIEGNASNHLYGLNYSILDECMDIEKNKIAMLERMHASVENEETIEHIKETEVLLPYIFMEKLRDQVWYRLREFFKLCNQETCSECPQKSKAYFKFLQAVALYEIFYIELVQEPAVLYMEQVVSLVMKIKERVEGVAAEGEILKDNTAEQLERNIPVIKRITESLYGIIEDDSIKTVNKVGIFQLLVVEFCISLNAMCYLLMVFESMHVCEENMKGIRHISLAIRDKLNDIYEKDLYTLVSANNKRFHRYREVNENLEKLIKNQYPACQNNDTADIIYSFMEELCKPVKKQNKNLLRGFEVLLGYPIYMDEDCKWKNTVK